MSILEFGQEAVLTNAVVYKNQSDMPLCPENSPSCWVIESTYPKNGSHYCRAHNWFTPEAGSPVDNTVKDFLNQLTSEAHELNKTWWLDPNGIPLDRNIGEMLALVHSEISEALEGHRKGLMDDKLPHRKMIEVELADAVIRIFDLAAGLNLDLGGAYVEKLEFNNHREDHKIEARMAEGGKKY